MKKVAITGSVFLLLSIIIFAAFAVSCGGGGGGAIAATGGNNSGKTFGSGGGESGSKIELTSDQLFAGETAAMLATETSYEFIRLKVYINNKETVYTIQKSQNIELNLPTTLGDKLQMQAEICDAAGNVVRTAASNQITIGMGKNEVVMYIRYKAKLHHADGTVTEYPFTSLGTTLPADTAPAPLAGYVFNSWCTTSDGTGTLYNAIAPNTRRDIDLYAYWIPGNGSENVARVTFNKQTGAVAYNTAITLACATPGATIYYTTDGSEPSTSSSVYAEGSTIFITENNTTIKAMAALTSYLKSVVTYATYTFTPARITYETDYGTAPDEITVMPGTALTAAELPEMEYYCTFNGWKKGAVAATVGTVITEDTTLTADWAALAAGKIILTNDNYSSYTADNIPANVEVCIDSSVSASALKAYFYNVLNDNTKNLTINMQYYTESISSLRFYNVAAKIILPDNLTSLSSDALEYADNLKEIIISSDNAKYCTIDGVLYTKDKKTIVRYPADKTGNSFTLPSTVRTVSYGAFCRTKNLETISNFNIVTSFTSMYTFGFSSITSLTLNDSITSFPSYTFKGSSLRTITLPASLRSIGFNSFDGCSSLTSITFRNSTAPTLARANNKAEFNGCTSLTKFYVPTGAKSNYTSASTWTDSSTNAFYDRLDDMVEERAVSP